MFVSSNIHRRILFSNSSFKRFNFTLLEQLNTNLHGISIPPQSCLQWRLWPVTSTRIFPPRARKYQDICEYSRGKWPTFCGFPNILINMVSPNSRIESKFIHFAKLQFQTIMLFIVYSAQSQDEIYPITTKCISGRCCQVTCLSIN